MLPRRRIPTSICPDMAVEKFRRKVLCPAPSAKKEAPDTQATFSAIASAVGYAVSPAPAGDAFPVGQKDMAGNVSPALKPCRKAVEVFPFQARVCV
jgi:hypothetical protein